MSIGILGEYVGRLFVESKQRPLYIVAENSEPVNHGMSPTTASVNMPQTRPMRGGHVSDPRKHSRRHDDKTDFLCLLPSQEHVAE